MSTILKALKKLEQETQSAGTAAAFQTLSDRPAEPPAPPRNRLWASIGIGASLLGLGLVLFFLLRPATPPATTQPQSQPVPAAPPKVALAPEDRLPMPAVFPPRQPGDPQPKRPLQPKTPSAASTAVAPARPPAPTAQMPAPPTPPTESPTQEGTSQPPALAEASSGVMAPKVVDDPAPKPKAEPMATPAIVPTVETPHKPAEAPPVKPEERPVPQPAPPVTAAKPATPTPASPPKPAMKALPQEAPAQKPVAPTEPAAPGPQPATMPVETLPEAPADPYANVPRLEENSPINLQAISWAETAGKSIAVINNSVLHEGDSVEGYSVVKIRPDDVIVRRNGRMWRVNF